jgi:uncharacterized protein involved in response to NO
MSLKTPTPVQRAGWRLLSSEAHRLMFFFGALQAVAAVLWWSIDLGARYVGWYAPPVWSVPPMWAHAWLLLYGIFPFFMFGFLMTAGPNWLGAPKTTRMAYVPAALMMAGGLALFYVGLTVDRSIAGAGVLLHFSGWFWGLVALTRMLTRYWSTNARYALVLFTFFGAGAFGSLLFGWAVATGEYGFAYPSLHGAVWFFLLPIFSGVGTRMVPFFSSRILGLEADYRPGWARPVLIGGALAHGALELAGAQTWLWIVDIPLAFAVGFLARKWGLGKSNGVRLLAVLHISLGILAGAFLLYGLQSAALAAGFALNVMLAPLHMLTIGYLAAMTLGMVSRVSLGHSGRPLEADTLTWSCYLGVLLCAALRVAAEFQAGTGLGGALMAASALAWLAAFGVWAARYVPMYVTPRIDAR